ncbi:MAG: hypothetical protein AAFQ14_20435 [Cyanobacteria bacterium J06621_12]
MESAENQEQPILGQESAPDPNPPLSKTETIALLNDSIDRLEETIKKISKDSATVPSSQSINTLLTTTQELEAAVSLTEAKVSKAAPALTEKQPPAIPPTPIKTVASQNPISQNVDSKVEPKTVATATAKKKNLGYVGLIIAGILVIAIAAGLWFWQPPQLTKLLPQNQSMPIETNSLPEQPIAPENSIEDSIGDTASDNTIVNVVSQDFPPEIESVGRPEEDIVETIIPEELTSPGKAKNLKMVAIKPELNFSPEQNLLAALNTRLSELAQAYPDETVTEVRPNLATNSLLVEVTDSWYSLDESEQNSLGQEILQRSRTFGFEKLELKDHADTLVARNPVVGDRIIVLYNDPKDIDILE